MSAALDLASRPRLNRPQQDVAQPSPAPTPSGCRWFVAATYPRAERRAHASLHLKGYRPYLPLVTVRQRDRTWHTAPLFAGYVFLQLDLAHPWYPVRFAPGVFQLLCINGIPIPCPRGAVEALRAAEAERAAAPAENTLWAPGMPCSLATGPFQGHPAVVLSTHDEIARVSLMCFGELRQVAVSVDCLSIRED